jgi:hypothetical protein
VRVIGRLGWEEPGVSNGSSLPTAGAVSYALRISRVACLRLAVRS